MNVDERIRAFEPFWGKWRIEGEAIGNGTFGQVYTVVSEDFGKVYEDALKHISIPRDQRELAEGYRNGSFSSEALAQSYYESSVQRLQKEIDLMYKFRGHSHIVNYQDHLIIAKKDMPGYDVFIRMEKLKTLYQVALEKGGLKQDDIIKIGLDICDALKTVHENKIIHRDIKPENVFYGKGEYKLGDFGVARTLNHTDKVTAAGTPNYMAPEIYRYGPVNSTADIYSLGIMLYRLLNGNRAPFLPADRNILITPNQEEEALSMRMRGEALPPLLGVDDRLMQVIRKACAFQPADRFQSAEEMTAALQACSGVAFSMPNISNATVIVNNSVEDQSSVSQTKSETKTETASQPANPRKKWVFPVVACGVLAIAVLALILLLGGKPVNEIPELDYKVMADNSVYLSWNECRQAVRYVVSGSDRDDGTELLPLTVTTSNYYLSSEFKTGNAASYQVSAIDADNEEEASGIIVVKLRQTAETTPTEEPTVEPTPTEEPTAEPTPTEEPTAEPTPTEEPTAVPTEEPTAVPTPTEEPTAVPTLIAEPIRTEKPTAVPAEEPTAEPTATFAEAPEFAAMSQQDYYDLALKNLSEGRKRAAFYNFLRAGDYQDAKLQARMCGNVVLFASSGCTDFAAVDSNGTVHFEDVSGHAFSETLGDDIDLFVNGFDWCWAIDETGMEYFYRKTGHSLQIDLPNKVEHKKLIKLENAYACYVGLKEDGTVDLYESDEMSARFDVNEIETWKNIVDIEASPTDLVGLRADGTVVIAGENAFRHDVSGWKNIKAIAVDEAVVGLREDGTVITTSEKVDVSSWKNIVAISTGGSAVFGIKSDGTVVVADWWNSISDFDDSEVESWEDIVAIEANSYVVIGMKSDGSLVAATSKGVLYSSHDKQQWKELWRTVSNWNLLTDIHAATPKLGEKIIDAQPFQPAACKHRMTWQVQTPATCGKAGEEAEICELCGEVGESRPLDPLGHAYELSSQQAATCGEAGYEEYTCSRCGVGYQETLAATGAHTMEWKTTQAATCAANGIKVQKCKVCGATGSSDSIAVLGHAYSKTDTQAATCGTAGYEKYTCSRCGDSYKETLAATGVHTMEWKTTQAATCTANGVKVQKCKACGATGESDSIAKLGHAYSKTDTKAATCGTAGYEKYTCSRCNASYQNTLAATGNHSYGAWQYYSADQDKRTCSCGAADYRSAVWSSWSSWSTTAVSASNTRQVETQTVTIVTGTYTKYTYNRWRYIGKNGNAWYHYREATDIDNYVRGGEWQYKTTTEPLDVAGSVYGRTYYEGYWYLVSTETIEETEEQIQYRYRTRQY